MPTGSVVTVGFPKNCISLSLTVNYEPTIYVFCNEILYTGCYIILPILAIGYYALDLMSVGSTVILLCILHTV